MRPVPSERRTIRTINRRGIELGLCEHSRACEHCGFFFFCSFVFLFASTSRDQIYLASSEHFRKYNQRAASASYFPPAAKRYFPSQDRRVVGSGLGLSMHNCVVS